MKRRVVLAALAIGVGLSLLLLLLAYAYESWCAERIYFGVQVWGIPVGGMRPSEAAAALEAELAELPQQTLLLNGPERSWEIQALNLGLKLEANATAWAAFRVGRAGNERLLDHLQLALDGRNLAPVLSYDDEAARLYLVTLAREVDQAPLDATFVLEDTTPVVTPAQAGREVDVAATLQALRAALGRPGTWSVDLVLRTLSPQVTNTAVACEQVASMLSEPFLLLLPDPREGDPGPWRLAPEELAALLDVWVEGEQFQVEVDARGLQRHLEGLAPELAVEPVNARFHFDDRAGELVPIAPSVDGRALDVAGSAQNVVTALDAGWHAAPLALQVLPPPYPDTATAAGLGIEGLVVEGDSYFIGSPSARDHNIRLAASRFDGIVIAPGETFSFNDYLGEVSAEAGYQEAYITVREGLAYDVGGGICQVSTTAFRAALWGGYGIIERWSHLYRVGYYELRGYGPGFDATVYSPYVDFKFVNDCPAPLLIETEVEDANHRLVFRFYSVDDGRRVEVEGPAVTEGESPGAPIYQLDESLPPGTVIEWQSAQNGLNATIERWVYDASGILLYHNVYVSEYAARRAAYHYGPGYEPPGGEE
ncbi:MAG: VanW family protein [Anaerolineae bacterium]|nr:VanW family protein [Anaerolineae bacterium]